MSFVTLRNAIEVKLNTVSKLQAVHTNPTKEFDGFPAAIIVPSDNTSLFETVSNNERDYGFTVFLIYPLKGVTEDTAYNAMYDLVDDVINTFDRDPYLEGTVSLPTGYTMITIQPVPGEWGEDSELQQLIARIDLRCRVSFDTLS